MHAAAAAPFYLQREEGQRENIVRRKKEAEKKHCVLLGMEKSLWCDLYGQEKAMEEGSEEVSRLLSVQTSRLLPLRHSAWEKVEHKHSYEEGKHASAALRWRFSAAAMQPGAGACACRGRRRQKNEPNYLLRYAMKNESLLEEKRLPGGGLHGKL